MEDRVPTEHGRAASSDSLHRSEHRLSEFIYGVVTGLVTIAGLRGGHATDWLGAALTIVIGAAAIWVAHAYSILISKRMAAGRRLSGRDFAKTLSGSWPIVSAGTVLALPLLPVGLGLWPFDVGLWISNLTGIALLALAGFLAGVIGKEAWARCLLLATLSAALGVVIVAVEFIINH